MYKVNRELLNDMIDIINSDNPIAIEKRKQLINCFIRNNILTSYYGVSWVELEVHIQGYYIKFIGTRCGCNIWFDDNDGELVIRSRKPRNTQLVYTDSAGYFESSLIKED